ncbi:MAG TPA: hypothetical protein VFG35_20850, partial [Actinoplanes sp.]|nr:hypothetical protein [Actinoplanes sp.]
MPSTPDRPDDSDDPFAVAEAAQVAVPATVERNTEAIDRPTGGIDRPTEGIDKAERTDDRRTVLVDDKMLGERATVRVPARRRSPPPPRPRRRAPLPVAAAFATLWAALITYLPVAAVIGLA